MQQDYKHNTVLLHEAVNGLNIKPDGIYIDGTFGRGGHTRLILSQLDQHGRLIAMDRDPEAIEAAYSINDSRFSIIHGAFSSMFYHVQHLNLLGKINGIILDLGVSSPQIDNPQRGFSFMHNGILDMRMDTTRGRSAAQWLAKANIKHITWVLKTFGEEKFAKRIAGAIVNKKHRQNIKYTKELATLITNTCPYYNRKKHPATRTFQAIRMYINDELAEIQSVLDASLKILAPGGRLSVISFHSLEDRLVKYFIRDYNYKIVSYSNHLSSNLYTHKEHQSFYLLQNIGKVHPSIQEIQNNPRARSSLLRLAEKIVI